METLTHFNSGGRVTQVHVGEKPLTKRRALAYGEINVSPTAIEALLRSHLKKGDALTTAKISGIMAAKRAADFIPLCHSLPLDWASISLEVRKNKIEVRATVEACAKTGVEMEALTAVSVACLTLYDMLKSLDKSITIGPIYLLEKSGGKSGIYRRKDNGC